MNVAFPAILTVASRSNGEGEGVKQLARPELSGDKSLEDGGNMDGGEDGDGGG